MSLNRALFLLVAVALAGGVLPAGLILDRRLEIELEARAHADLGRAVRVLEDRENSIADALMMHAKEVAHAPGLAEAVVDGRTDDAAAAIESARGGFGDTGVLYDVTGAVLVGDVLIGAGLLEATAAGEMPVAIVANDSVLYRVGLAPVEAGGVWIGAAGVAERLDDAYAGLLAALVHAEVVIETRDGRVVAMMADPENRAVLGTPPAARDDAARDGAVHADVAHDDVAHDDVVSEIRAQGRRLLVARAPLGSDATVAFVRNLEHDLAILPKLRVLAATTGAGALVLSLMLALLLASALTRPVRSLVSAAERVAAGDFSAPLRGSRITEVNRLSQTFGAMRSALGARLADLERANAALAERQERLRTLQGELIQREQLASNGRLVAGLAHEIRNPIANVRNCLELVHRRLRADPEGAEFTGMAIDELLRMHELAEQLLDLNRPRDPAITTCWAGVVAREVAQLFSAGTPSEQLTIRVAGDGYAAVAPDVLKQVLVNLIQNARDAQPVGLIVEISVQQMQDRLVIRVADNGPGVPESVKAQLFEPFVTTKQSVGGVGLGLFVAEGQVRRYGGGIRLAPDRSEPGAVFEITLVAATRRGAPDMLRQPAAAQS
jgi:signal transduction histidine kinase